MIKIKKDKDDEHTVLELMEDNRALASMFGAIERVKYRSVYITNRINLFVEAVSSRRIIPLVIDSNKKFCKIPEEQKPYLNDRNYIMFHKRRFKSAEKLTAFLYAEARKLWQRKESDIYCSTAIRDFIIDLRVSYLEEERIKYIIDIMSDENRKIIDDMTIKLILPQE